MIHPINSYIIIEIKGDKYLGTIVDIQDNKYFIDLDNGKKISVPINTKRFLKKVKKKVVKNRWAISDIHGCFKTFKKLLSKIDYDELYLLGDYIDRGLNSKEVIDFLMKNNDIICLKGNQEAMLLDSLHSRSWEKNFILNGGLSTLKSFEVDSVKEIPTKYISWFKKLKMRVVLEDYILVHAGLNFNLSDPLEESMENHELMLWDRSREYNSEFLTKQRLIVGHTPKSLDVIKESLNHRKVFIDGGCVYDRYLVAFCLDTNELVIQKNIED